MLAEELRDALRIATVRLHAQVQGFYDTLLAAMKMGGSAKVRYDKLKPTTGATRPTTPSA